MHVMSSVETRDGEKEKSLLSSGESGGILWRHFVTCYVTASSPVGLSRDP